MGFNISGIAINKNYSENFQELQKEFDWSLTKIKEINFEDASANWKEEDICDVYFTEKGTLLFLNMDMCTQSWEISTQNTLTFALSETSMAFNLNYCENAVEIRSIMEVNGKRIVNEGSKLEIEAKSENTSEIIWNQMELLIGKKFWDIEPDEKAMRYSFIKSFNIDEFEIEYINEGNVHNAFIFNETKILKFDFDKQFIEIRVVEIFEEMLKAALNNRINIFLKPENQKEHNILCINLQTIVDEIKKLPYLVYLFKQYNLIENIMLIGQLEPNEVSTNDNIKAIEWLKNEYPHSKLSSFGFVEFYAMKLKWEVEVLGIKKIKKQEVKEISFFDKLRRLWESTR